MPSSCSVGAGCPNSKAGSCAPRHGSWADPRCASPRTAAAAPSPARSGHSETRSQWSSGRSGWSGAALAGSRAAAVPPPAPQGPAGARRAPAATARCSVRRLGASEGLSRPARKTSPARPPPPCPRPRRPAAAPTPRPGPPPPGRPSSRRGTQGSPPSPGSLRRATGRCREGNWSRPEGWTAPGPVRRAPTASSPGIAAGRPFAALPSHAQRATWSPGHPWQPP
mmetsp:Transcript_14229/g.42361  ORF Transcript_14229/g.42361 Transcript_14229/m.42361 type:complete len:224 (+) Transcript_14229:129-800(+)